MFVCFDRKRIEIWYIMNNEEDNEGWKEWVWVSSFFSTSHFQWSSSTSNTNFVDGKRGNIQRMESPFKFWGNQLKLGQKFMMDKAQNYEEKELTTEIWESMHD